MQLCHSAILNVWWHYSSIVNQKNYILVFFTFCFLPLSLLSLIYSLSLIELLPPHTFSHPTSLFLIQSLHWSWVGFMVTAWRSAWILDGSKGGVGICGGGSMLVGGMVVVRWLWFFFFLFLVAGSKGIGRKRGKGRESETVKKRIFK